MTKTEKAETAINTFTSCFDSACVDVARNKIKPAELSETYYQRFLSGPPERQVESIVNYLKTIRPFWDIIIKFPHETITNEYGKKTDLYDFYVKVSLAHRGTFHSILSIKSTYTEDQFYSGYVHSHCPSLRHTEEGIKEWKSMCFGSGPINSSMDALRSERCNENMWIAFASELRQWVRTESVDGGPYFRMEHISNKYEEIKVAVPERPPYIAKSWLQPLMKSYLRAKRLKIGYTGSRYCLGTTFAEWLVDFSNYALVWRKKNQVPVPTMDTMIINNNICRINNSRVYDASHAGLIGRTVLTFKGEEIPLKVIPGEKVEHLNLIKYTWGLYIAKNILNTINTYYGCTETTDTTTPVQWG